MPRHSRHQSLKRGVTLIELLIAMTTAVTIATAATLLFKVAIRTYQTTARQTLALGSIRNALAGNGSSPGMLEAARLGKTLSSLGGSPLVVLSTSGVSSTFSLSGTDLYRADSAGSTVLAGSISTMTFGYYNMNASGLIMQSTAAASATMVTAQVTLTGTGTQKTYVSFGGARLRNHP